MPFLIAYLVCSRELVDLRLNKNHKYNLSNRDKSEYDVKNHIVGCRNAPLLLDAVDVCVRVESEQNKSDIEEHKQELRDRRHIALFALSIECADCCPEPIQSVDTECYN